MLRADRQPGDEETSSHQADYHHPAARDRHVDPPLDDLLYLLTGRKAAVISWPANG
jgi:hypothetical protein